MKVLVACEYSGTVRDAFIKRGHDAVSCDILPTDSPGPHYQGDVLDILNDGWDLMIAHPPCTFMSNAGARWMYPTKGNIDQKRLDKALEAKEFFMTFLNADIPKICVENPNPLKIVMLPQHTQIIQPFEYGEPYSKKTLLWLKGLPKLIPTCIIHEHTTFCPSNTGGKKRGEKYSNGVAKNGHTRSKTFQGIAEAMASQWG